MKYKGGYDGRRSIKGGDGKQERAMGRKQGIFFSRQNRYLSCISAICMYRPYTRLMKTEGAVGE